VQIPAMVRVGFRFWPSLGFGRADVRKAFKLMGPRVLGLSMSQLTLLINTAIASFVGVGSITVFYLADNLQALPLGMIGIAFAITSFATLAELASEPTTEKFAQEIKRVMNRILFWILPATVGLFLLREPVIQLILRHGKFTEHDAQMTAGVLAILLGSLVFQALIPTLVRGFYAFHEVRVPLMSGFISEILSVSTSITLAWGFHWGIYGIATGVAFGNFVNFSVLAYKMRRKIGHAIFKGLWKEIFATAVMGLVIYAGMQKIMFPELLIGRVIYLGGATLLGAIFYFGTMRVLPQSR
jgi:putative peptidoglycan lipid II flippase